MAYRGSVFSDFTRAPCIASRPLSLSPTLMCLLIRECIFFQGVYDASYHPKYKAGEWTEDQVFENWLLNFTKSTTATDVQVRYIGGLRYAKKVPNVLSHCHTKRRMDG